MDVKTLLEKSFTREEFLQFCKDRTDEFFSENKMADKSKKMAEFIGDPAKPFGCQTEVMMKLFSIVTGDDLARSGRLVYPPGAVVVVTSRSGENYPLNKPILMLTRLHGVLYDGVEAYFGNWMISKLEEKKNLKKPTRKQIEEAVDELLASTWKWIPPILMDEHKCLSMPWAWAEMYRQETSEGIIIADLDPVHPMFFHLSTRDEARSVSKY
jgi:hypothetical protein